MHFKRPTRSLTAWIAMFAILLGALAPALSHALSHAGSGKRTVQVCTVAGMKMVAIDDKRDHGKAGGAKLLPGEHCAFCATHGGAPTLPSAPLHPFGARDSADHFPALFFSAPRPLFVWAASQPRAPPRQYA
jgi:DUF2946 family protein